MAKIAIVDIETSGFLGQGGKILEIGIAGLDLDTGEVTEEYDSLIKEDGFDESHTKAPFGWIFSNSDLTFEDVMGGKDLKDELPKIQAVFDKFPDGATAFNRQFDFGFLNDRDIKAKECSCIMLKAMPIVKMPAVGKRSGYKWPKVQEAWDFFFPEDDYIEKHRALDDAVHEAKIAFEIKRLEGKKNV